MAATPAARAEAERVGTTEPGQDEIHSEKGKVGKKSVKKAKADKKVNKAKAVKTSKKAKAAHEVEKTDSVEAVQSGVPTNLGAQPAR